MRKVSRVERKTNEDMLIMVDEKRERCWRELLELQRDE